MTPAAIFSVVKDGLIIAAVAFVCWFLVHTGENVVKVGDLQAVTKQLQANAEQVEKWQQQKDQADGQLQIDLSKINTQPPVAKPPVWVCNNAGPKPVPGIPGPAANVDPGAGGGIGPDRPGTGKVDVGPAVDAAERTIETALAECRDLRDSWPKATGK